MASCTVNQINSKAGPVTSPKTSFFNVDEEFGYIDVWGSLYNFETLLCWADTGFMFIQFDNKNFMEEWYEINSKYYHTIKKVEIGGILTVIKEK